MTTPAPDIETVREQIPLVDLSYQSREIAKEVRDGFARVVDDSAFVNGPDVAAFEQELADFCGVEHSVGVANGTDALELALRAVDVGPGAEVILPANTFVATAEAVVRAGARPVVVDCDPETLLLDPDSARQRASAATRAVIAVHLFGQLAPVEELADLAADGCVLVEDAAQAHGATRHDAGVGSLGRVAATSFYPGKNLGAYGDAGAVLTNHAVIDDRVRALRSHGETRRYEHSVVGFNSRLDTLQAVVLRAKLRRLASWNEMRREAARRYDELLRGSDNVIAPSVLPENVHAWHLYVVRVRHRDEVLRRLREAGIHAGVHYPVPVHLQPAFAWLGYREGDFPVAEAAASEILSLPMFPGITVAQQERVVEVLTPPARRARHA